MSATIDTWTGRIGLLAGFCAVAGWLAIAGRPADAVEPPASIRLGTLATGELDISPLGRPVLEARDLRPGGHGAAGRLTVRNQTPQPLNVAVRTTSVGRDLDGSAWIELFAGARRVVHAPMSRTRRWSAQTMRLSAGQRRTLHARVWIPAGADQGWQAAKGDVTLELRGKVPGR